MANTINNKNNKRNTSLATKLKLGLSVASINVGGITSDPDKRVQLSAWVNAHSTDIVCMQEYYKRHEYSKVEFDMNNFGNYDLVLNDKNTKTLILIKREIQHEKIIDLYCNIEGLDCVWVAVFSCKYIIIIGSIYHSPDRKYDNIDFDIIYDHMNMIKERYKEKNKKIIFHLNGDLNAKNPIWGSTKLDNRGMELANWIAKNNLECVNDGSPTHRNSTTGKEDAIDLTLITMDAKRFNVRWKVHKDLTDSYGFSDHYIIESLVNLNPIVIDNPDKITWNFDETLIGNYNDNMINKMNKWKNYYNQLNHSKMNVNRLVELFQLLFVQASIETFGFKYYNSKDFNYLSKKMIKLIDDKRKLTNQLSHLISQIKRKSKRKFNSTLELFRSNIPKRLKKYWKRLKNKINKINKKMYKSKQDTIIKSTMKMEKLINNDGAKNDKTFWSMSNKLTKSNSNTIPPQRDSKTNRIVATTMEEITEHIHQHFISPVTRNRKDYKKRHLLFHQEVEKWKHNYKFNNNNNSSILNRQYSKQEVLKVIGDLNKDSAMAFDFIHFKLIQWCKYSILDNLTLLFNLCFYKHQVCPNIWKYGEYIPVPKPGRPSQFAKNIRPIMVIPGLARIISKLNCNRILTDCVNRKLLSARNCAFQKNKSTHDITLDMTENLYQCFQNGHFCETSFEDLKSAYDSVWIDGLLYKMVNEYNIDGNMIAYIHSQSTNRKTRVSYNGINTSWKDGQDNLPQGMPDSIALFILLYNNPNINKTKNNNMNKYQIETIEYNDIDENNQYHNRVFNFDIDFKNFADDSGMDTIALPIKIKLTNKIKRDYRLAMQLAIEDLYDYTRFYQLVVSKIKCSTISFSNKQDFQAYVYQLGDDKLELIHSNQHTPMECKHNGRQQYSDGLLRLDENYKESLIEGNGLLDLSNLNSFGEMIDRNLNGFSNISIGKEKDKSIVFSEYDLPKSVRILGIHFDPKMYFNEHLKIIINKAKYKLYKLRQLAYCKYYNFSSHTIYKLYESVIQSKLEYGLSTIANENKLNILETFRRKAVKIALKLKKQTPTIYLDEFLNARSLRYRLDVARIKLWNQYSRAPSYLLKYHTFNKWKKYILLNGGNINECKKLKNRQIGRDEYFKLENNNFNFIIKSPLSQAYLTMDKILPIEHKIFRKRKKDVLKPVPCFNNVYPNNVNVYGMNKQFKNPKSSNIGNMIDPVLWEFYSDGSCMPNPGPGGSGYFSSDFVIKSKIEPIDHDTTINYCELNGIKMIYNDVLKEMNKFGQRYSETRFINIFTDSQFVINNLDISGYPKLDYYYQLIEEINGMANLLNKFNIQINIIKIESHIGIQGNQHADALAKAAATIAHNCKYNLDDIIKYNTFKNPINVDINKDIIWLNKLYKKERKDTWMKRQDDWKGETLNPNEYIGDMIMQKYIVSKINNKYIVRNPSKNLRNQLKHLKQYESEIVNKLRSECINLNGYKKFRYDESNGKCIYCNVEETVKHFLIDCCGSKSEYVNYHNENEMYYDEIRFKFRKELQKIAIFFKEEKNFNVINLLFPNVWQQVPEKTNPNYHDIKEKNNKREVEVLKCVVRFVQHTRRFKKEKYGI